MGEPAITDAKIADLKVELASIATMMQSIHDKVTALTDAQNKQTDAQIASREALIKQEARIYILEERTKRADKWVYGLGSGLVLMFIKAVFDLVNNAPV